MDRITVTLAPEAERVRMLAAGREGEILRAVLGPAAAAHPRAAATLLEGLALWHQRTLSVVLCADDSDDGSAMGLYDALGCGTRALHYEVGVALRGPRPRRSRGGLGDFRDLRQLSLLPGVFR
ncbi:MAG: hypothetical protein FJ207_15600 [Gemmatimonadetes bacterium]|nr:hypothetical protein [Gemmatimonadota bacterium]